MSSTCVVVGNRASLSQIEGPLHQALEATNLDRVVVKDLNEFDEVLQSADLVVADVSKISPSLSFQLGSAKALGLPILYLARRGAKVAPVFGPVLHYVTTESEARLAYVIARAIEDVVEGRAPELELAEASEEHTYAPGDHFVGYVAHVSSSGYVLVTEVGRQPSLLPFSMMVEPDLLNSGGRVVLEGDLISVDVVDVDGDRVTLRESDDPMPLRLSRQLRDAQSILRAALLIQSVVGDSTQVGAKSARSSREQRVFEWMAIHPSASKRLREGRNILTHGDHVDTKDLASLGSVANDLLEVACPRSTGTDPESQARLLVSTAELERLLVRMIRVAGGGVSVRTQGLLSLSISAERIGAISKESSLALQAVGHLRNRLAGHAGEIDSWRVGFAMELANIAREDLLRQLHDLEIDRQVPSAFHR